MPNNWDELKEFIDYFIQEFLTARDPEETTADSVLDKRESISMIQGFKELKNTHLEAIKRKKDFEMAEKNTDKSLKDIYDYLFYTKVNANNFNNPAGFAYEITKINFI